MGMENIENANWWKYLDSSMQELMSQSLKMTEREEARAAMGETYQDYAFVVFPAAKAYEGFLKKLFLDMGLITKQQYNSDHFRIGRALSPSLPKRYRSGWVYGRLAGVCGGEELPLEMWEVWKKGRNRTFHFFPHRLGNISLAEAKLIVEEIGLMMEKALVGCRRVSDVV
jgi:hypothetical protein